MRRHPRPSSTKIMSDILIQADTKRTEEVKTPDSLAPRVSRCAWVSSQLKWAYNASKNKLEYLYSNADYITGNSFPHIPRLKGQSFFAPLLGMLPEFCAKDGLGPSRTDIKAAELTSKCGLAYYWVLNKRAVVLGTPAYTYQFEQQQKKFSRSEAVEMNFAIAFGKHNTVTAASRTSDKKKNAEWYTQKDATLNATKGQDLSYHLPEPIGIILDDIFKELDSTFSEAKENKIELNLEKFCSKITLLIGAKTLFGVPIDDKKFAKHTDKFDDAFLKITRELTNNRNALLFKLKQKLPYTQHFIGKSSLDIAKEKLTALVKKYYLEPYNEDIIANESFIKHIAKLDPINQDKEDHELILDSDEMINKINLGLLSVTDTTARLIQFTIMYLACNREILERVRAEIEEHKPSASSQWSKNEIDNLKFLNACIKEAARLHPGAPILGYVATEEVTFGDIPCQPKGGYNEAMKNRDKARDVTLRKGDIAIMPLFKLQRSSDYFENANVFNPDRFMLDENKKLELEHEHRYSYRPFGFGERFCPGFQFAPFEAAVAIVKLILSHFDFSIDVAMPFETQMSATIKHKGNVFLTLRKESEVKLEMKTPRTATRA